MKRLPISAALLLLFAGVWFCLSRQESSLAPTHGEISDATLRLGPAVSKSQASPPLEPGNLSRNKPLRTVSTPTPPLAPGLPITEEFVRNLITGPANVTFPLPDGRSAKGTIEQRHDAANGSPVGVSGRLSAPGKGTFHFRLQPADAPSGPVIGTVVIKGEEIAFRVEPGPDQTARFSALPVDQVICRNYALPPEHAAGPEEIPADHPTDIATPSYQNGIIPLQSRPGAAGVIYLDFDGEPGPHENWGTFDALPPSGMTPALTKDIWTRVSEDFAPFNLNVTTDLQVFLNASETTRQRCIITPSENAAPGSGGVAFMGSFGWSGDTPCWCYYSSNAKYATEIISHEIGHTLGLAHDGRNPAEDYYLGHGSDPVGWAPIMGAGYYKNLSQWSKGEYDSANQQQNDIAIIANNHGVGYITDDAGDSHATAAILEVFENGTIHSQGNIGLQNDIDAFHFTTTGGTASLVVSPVAAGPNLDILAGIYDELGNPVIFDNPDLALKATLSTTLPAGSYSVRVDGTGRGNPLTNGYTDYGSLGQYTITGTIEGALGPDRFDIAENTPTGSIIGTPTARNNHEESPLTYQITGGNTDSAFAIDSDTGVITVANDLVLDYEALSAGWEDPAGFDLAISITDTVNPGLNESVRVVVTVTDVNEPPSITSGPEIIAISHTLNGVTLGNIAATDPDRFDFVTLEIVSGDPMGKFALSPSGLLTVNGTLDAAVQSSYPLTIRATDHGSPAITRDELITVSVISVPVNYTPGFVYHTFYDYIYGSDVGDLASDDDFPTRPNREVMIHDFTSESQGENYGSTVRAWLIAPVTGTYRFWISANNSADLYLSEDGIPANMANICGLDSSTNKNQWDKYGTQKSVAHSLTAGQVCYIEARHKQSYGKDHLSVAWEIKDETDTQTRVAREIIPGRYLTPHYLNYSPRAYARDASIYRNSYSGYRVASLFATDSNSTDSLTWSITAGNESGIFSIDPVSGVISVANRAALASEPSNTIPLTLTVTDSGSNPLSDSDTMRVQFLDPLSPPPSGLLGEVWEEIPGDTLSSLYASPNYPDNPDRIEELDAMDIEPDYNDNSGTRIRAYIIPPSTGSYTFYISSDKAGSLLLSNNTNPDNAIPIATVSSSCDYQDWTANSSQSSFPVPLAAGQRYFIEARVKANTDESHLSVAWSGPGIQGIRVIQEIYTEPYDSNSAPVFAAPSYRFDIPRNYAPGTMAGTVTATDSSFEEIRYSILSGDPLQAFAIDPVTGNISIMNPGSLIVGSVYQLQVGAQDSGHSRHFAPKESVVPVTVVLPNDPPEFTESPVLLGDYPAGEPMSASLASYVTDPEDAVVFSMVSGPSWISLSPTGELSGTPSYDDFGPTLITISVDDGHDHIVEGTVSLTVSSPADIPAATLTLADAVLVETTGSLAAETSGNADASDNLYLSLTEEDTGDTSALEVSWTFPTPPNRLATLTLEAHHSENTEGDDFQISVSTDDGANFTDAILITKTADDDTPQLFTFITGDGTSTIIRIMDTDRTPSNTTPDTLSIDLLDLTLSANHTPAANDATFQVASHAPVGIDIGSIATTDPDPEQTLSYNILRGNEAGLFTLTPEGMLLIAADIPPESGPVLLIVVSTDDGIPVLANYSTITVDIVEPVLATITLENLTPTYNGAPQVVTITTDPPGLQTTLTYDESTEAPSDAGDYLVSASIIDPLHVGNASEMLSIGKAPAEIAITGLTQIYDGTPKSVSVTTSPPELGHTLSYDASLEAPTYFGDYTVTVTINDPNYAGTSIETFSITHHLTITDGQSHHTTVTAVPYQCLTNDGTLVVSGAPLHIAEDATNNGIIRLYGDAVFEVSGTFTNTGVIDTINWNGTLPPSMINTGTIIDRSAHRIISSKTTASQITLKFPAYEGHLYQLETTADLGSAWSPAGPSFAIPGDPLNPPILQFSNNLDGPRHFYRISVKPAP